ncbi:MAG TPA: hypothetical protein VGP36_15190 [Mycobacteriales bacterium]|nr:hypothetical protein [Mycobacteriales bacterium]
MPVAAAVAWLRVLVTVLAGLGFVGVIVFAVLVVVAAMSGSGTTSGDYGSVY